MKKGENERERGKKNRRLDEDGTGTGDPREQHSSPTPVGRHVAGGWGKKAVMVLPRVLLGKGRSENCTF